MMEGSVTISLEDFLEMKHEIDSAPQKSEIKKLIDKWTDIFGNRPTAYSKSNELINDLNKLLK